jgi:hypothetical protein
MDTDYPVHLLAREPAPPYVGEGPFAVWHLSEDPSLGRFLPRRRAANSTAPPLVWAVDTRHAPMFWFPRDCPRGCIWPVSAHGGRQAQAYARVPLVRLPSANRRVPAARGWRLLDRLMLALIASRGQAAVGSAWL